MIRYAAFGRLLAATLVILGCGCFAIALSAQEPKIVANDQLQDFKVWDVEEITKTAGFDVKKIAHDAKAKVVTWDVKGREIPGAPGFYICSPGLLPNRVCFYDAKNEKLKGVVGKLTWKKLKGDFEYRAYFDYSKIKDKLANARGVKLVSEPD